MEMENASQYWEVFKFTLAFTSIVLVLIFKHFFKIYNKKFQNTTELKKLGRKRLPGPINIPILGSVLHILVTIRRIPLFSTTTADVLKLIKNGWGDLVGIQIGSTKFVIINDIHVAKKLMCSEEWSDRLDENPLLTGSQNLGLLFSNGESWKEIRRYTLKSLTNQGFSKSNNLQTLHEVEMQNFTKYLDKQIENGNGVVEFNGIFDIPALNILWSMIGNSRFSYEDKEIQSVIDCLKQFGQSLKSRDAILLIFPWLQFIPFVTEYYKTKRNCLKMQTYFQALVEEKRSKGAYKSEQNNFIDSFLKEIDCHKEQDIQPNYYTDEQLVRILIDFFIAGFKLTASSLEFLLIFMILNPKIQERCQAEIDTVIGTERQPRIEDREKMPYVQAACLEVLRMVTLLPIVTRCNIRDTFLQGYFIPKNTIAAINCYGIHHDPRVWESPEEFRPERFLDSKGKLINQEGILAFGKGKRFCPAESFSKISFFLIFVNIMQRYTFEGLPKCKMPDHTPLTGITSSPKPFKAIVKQR